MKPYLFTALLSLLPFDFLHAEKMSDPIFTGTINGHSVEISIRYGKFKNSKRVVKWTTTKHENDGKVTTFKSPTINGNFICGAENESPADDSEIIESIIVVWDGEMQEIPEKLFAHVVAPHENGVTFSMDAKGEAMVVHMTVGDGGGSDAISWRFGKDKQSAMIKTPFFPVSN